MDSQGMYGVGGGSVLKPFLGHLAIFVHLSRNKGVFLKIKISLSAFLLFLIFPQKSEDIKSFRKKAFVIYQTHRIIHLLKEVK